MRDQKIRRRTWFSLPSDERRALRTMLWLVPVLHVTVRVFDYRKTRAFLDRHAARTQRRGGTTMRVDAARLATMRVMRYSWLPGNCLSRSLGLIWMLERSGYAPELRLGVSLAGGDFAAHAWVELDGRVLNDRPDVHSRYAAFETSGPSRWQA